MKAQVGNHWVISIVLLLLFAHGVINMIVLSLVVVVVVVAWYLHGAAPREVKFVGSRQPSSTLVDSTNLEASNIFHAAIVAVSLK